MSYDVTASFKSQTASIEGSWPLDFFVINASPTGVDYLYYVNHNGNVYGYDLNSAGNVTSDATLYTGLPSEHGGVTTNIEGEIPSIEITVPNIDRSVESLIQNNNYLRGRDVHIMTFFAKHLPSGVTPLHLGGTDADYRNHIKEKMYVDSVTTNENVVTFSCKPKFEIRNVTIPRRTFSRECYWAHEDRYLDTECDPGNTVDSVTYTTCGGTLASCRERLNASRFGGFPSVPSRGITII